MDHYHNASDPESMDGVVAVPEPGDAERESAVEHRSGDGARDDDTARALDRWADRLRQRHLRNALASLEERDDVDEETRAAVAACSRAIVDDVLRAPRWRIRNDGEDVAERATALFDLEND